MLRRVLILFSRPRPLLGRSVLVVGVLLVVEVLQALGLGDEGLPLGGGQVVPASAQLLGQRGVLDLGVLREDPLPLVVREHHERVHRPLDVLRGVAPRLRLKIYDYYLL